MKNKHYCYCEEWHCHHLPNPQMILTKTLAPRFPTSHGSAGSSIAAGSDTWQKVWGHLTEMQVMVLFFDLQVALESEHFLHSYNCQLRQGVKSCALPFPLAGAITRG